MRVFVTGSTGFVGSAVVADLIKAGHQVLGLVRSDAGAKALAAAGGEPHRGDIDDLDSLRRGAAAADGVIHTAFNHDFSKFKENCEADRRVIDAMGSVLVGSTRPFVVTSGTALVSGKTMATEDDVPAADSPNPRVASEQAAAAVAAQGVSVSLVRLPPSTHGDGDHGFMAMLAAVARDKGVSVYAGAGANRWPAAHRFDAAIVYRLALEKNIAGARYHASAEEGVAFKDIATAIGRQLNVPVASKTPEEAAAHFGWFAHFAALDCPSSSAKTRAVLGWKPTHPGLIADINRPAYFKE
jgi:nucleoside-diphosphate-sugar epimerase